MGLGHRRQGSDTGTQQGYETFRGGQVEDGPVESQAQEKFPSLTRPERYLPGRRVFGDGPVRTGRDPVVLYLGVTDVRLESDESAGDASTVPTRSPLGG